ncbi:MAG: GTPase [Planctomycetota bacterium]
MTGTPPPSANDSGTSATAPLEVACYRATPHGMGAVAVVEVIGDVSACLEALCGKDVEVGGLRMRNFGRIDDGLVARLAPERAQLMPHGGTRIVERLAEWLESRGANWIDGPLAARAEMDPAELFPEAQDRVEALALATLARAASPLALQLLLAQADRWRAHGGAPLDTTDHAPSARLMRLVDPARVVLVGRPNAGKSTLSNALLGAEASIVSPEAGTTRDAVGARIDLGGLVVEWFDLPGLRDAVDPIEREAIELAHGLLSDADLVIALAAPGVDWPELGCKPHVRLASKCDLGRVEGADLAVSARTGEGMRELRDFLRERIVPAADRESKRPWIFDPRLVGG